MVNFGKEYHQRKLEETRKDLEAKGFTVIVFKERIPDAVAFKGEGFLIEVTHNGQQKTKEDQYRKAYGGSGYYLSFKGFR